MFIRNAVKDMLPQGNFEVLEAKDGLDGLNIIRNENPNLILLDFILPKLSGWEVYQELQKNPRLKIIPLVLMSGRKDEVTDKLTEPFEQFAFIEKPFDKNQLLHGIKDAMGKADKLRQSMQQAPATVAAVSPSTASSSSDELKIMNQKIAKMQTEIDNLKKTVNQLMQFIKQKLS